LVSKEDLMTLSFAVGIPTINRADLLEMSVADLASTCPNATLIVVDNGHQGLRAMLESSGLSFVLIENEANKGVAGSWNQLAEAAWSKGLRWVWICNDDIILGKNEADIDALCQGYDAEPRLLNADIGWCSFLLPRAIWDEVGPFDELFFPAYYEDDDYRERLLRAGKPVVIRTELNPLVYKESMTVVRDPSLRSGWDANQERFIMKWGAEALYRLMAK